MPRKTPKPKRQPRRITDTQRLDWMIAGSCMIYRPIGMHVEATRKSIDAAMLADACGF